ncbi:class I SAM-dependent methyltransferase [Mycetohabitans sp. B46]|uniref:class I SAM-dependent methyltransferase n=1 Tax=Mycetohabitans sp. B46 TaxID=2772536 RepID=UPI00307CCB06
MAVCYCKVCDAPADLDGYADFSKSCVDPATTDEQANPLPIPYMRCSQCGLLFTKALDQWSSHQFLSHVYNEDYVSVDPDVVERRPTQNALLVRDLLQHFPTAKVMDYGTGSGRMPELLRQWGVHAHGFEPIGQAREGHAKISHDMVTAFEVLEHTPTPRDTVAQMLSFAKPQGVCLFSTYTSDNILAHDVGHWYVAPRNGHVTIYTRRALAQLFSGYGWSVRHLSDGLHIAFHRLPSWLPAQPLIWHANPEIPLEPISSSGEPA